MIYVSKDFKYDFKWYETNIRVIKARFDYHKAKEKV